MISKGCMEMIPLLLPHGDELAHELLITCIHNLLGVVSNFPAIIFEIAVGAVVDLILYSDDDVILQYGAACLYIFTQEKMRNNLRLSTRVLKVLPKLLTSENCLTQYFSVITSANMFFQDLW